MIFRATIERLIYKYMTPYKERDKPKSDGKGL